MAKGSKVTTTAPTGAAAGGNTAPTGETTAASTAKAPRTVPTFAAVRTDIPMPSKAVTNRGSKTIYPFNTLTAVGASFGVKDRTAKGMASVISNQNRKPSNIVKRNPDGSTVFKMTELKDGAGNVTGRVPTGEAEMLPGPQYWAADVDPATDPDGASVRVWLKSLPEQPTA